jgi:hypothetical protein
MTLYYVPMAHDEEVLERLPRALEHFKGKTEGKLAWKIYWGVWKWNTDYWKGVRKQLDSLEIRKIYSDSAVSGEVTGWRGWRVRARKKDVNYYSVIDELIAKGAKPMVTEREDYFYLKLEERDKYRDKLINKTLDGDVGVLFMGSKHRYPKVKGLNVLCRRRDFDHDYENNYGQILQQFMSDNGLDEDGLMEIHSNLCKHMKEIWRKDAEAVHGKRR